MGKGNLTLKKVTTDYQYENGEVTVEGHISRAIEEDKVTEFTGIVRLPGENGMPGEVIGNFRGVQRGEVMNYSFNEMTLDNNDVVKAAVREVEPLMITTKAEAEE